MFENFEVKLARDLKVDNFQIPELASLFSCNVKYFNEKPTAKMRDKRNLIANII